MPEINVITRRLEVPPSRAAAAVDFLVARGWTATTPSGHVELLPARFEQRLPHGLLRRQPVVLRRGWRSWHRDLEVSPWSLDTVEIVLRPPRARMGTTSGPLSDSYFAVAHAAMESLAGVVLGVAHDSTRHASPSRIPPARELRATDR